MPAPWNRRQPARAARSARRTGGWGGSVCSRRCAPRPLAAAARAEHRANNTNFRSNFNSARRRQGLPAPSRARRPQRRVVNAANFRSNFNSASRERASGADVAEPGVAHVDRLARGARSAPSPAAAPRSPHPLRGLIQRSPERHRQPRSEIRKKNKTRRRPLRTECPHMESAAAGASRSVGAAHRRLGRVGLLTPMRAAPPRGRGAGRAQGERRQFQKQFQ